MRRLIVMALGLSALCACTDEAPSSAAPDAQTSDSEVSEAPEPDLLGAVIPLEGCNPVAQEWSCFYPFPTDLFLTTDDALPSGYRVAVPAAAQPEHIDGGPAEALIESDLDGASVFPMIEVLLPAPIDAPGAPERVAGVNHRHRHAIPFTLDNDDFETCEYSRDVPISSDFLERLAEFDY